MPPKRKNNHKIASRFRGLLPVVVDVETGGLNPAIHPLLEIAVVTLSVDVEGKFYRDNTYAYHVEPFQGAQFDPDSLALTGIDPSYPLRFAIPEKQVLHLISSKITPLLEKYACQRAILVGHNAWFDLAFIQAARKRVQLSDVPFHSFTTLDTASLSAYVLGETVLARALRAANIPFDIDQAHSAIYDAERTAELFCYLLNK